MADRRFNIAETIGSYGSYVKYLNLQNSQNQPCPAEVEHTRSFVNAHICAERFIGLLNNIISIDILLTKPHQHKYVSMSSPVRNFFHLEINFSHNIKTN